MKTQRHLFIGAAYGRTYPTVELVRQDWQAGKDFRIVSGPYCSIRDLDAIFQDYDEVLFWSPLFAPVSLAKKPAEAAIDWSLL